MTAKTESTKANGIGLGGLGRLLHGMVRKEKTGASLALLLCAINFVQPLHSVLSWDGSMDWPMAAVLALAAFFVVVAVWYTNAQVNAVRRAVSGDGVVDPQQANRDYGWSILPVIPVIISTLLTLVALALLLFTDVFTEPGTWWIRDRMLVSPTMLFMHGIVLWMVKADLGNNNAILTEMTQLAGRLTRFERVNHEHN